MKKLREKCKNKKGFTMVELIVVIVIILVLAAVLVPSLLKYINKANEANVKSDAATALVQLQADYAAYLAGEENSAPTTSAGIDLNPITGKTELAVADVAAEGEGYYIVSSEEIISFGYRNSKYVAIWSKNPTVAGAKNGWSISSYTAAP